MSRRRTRWDANSYGIFVIGEQIRIQMHDQAQVRDRRYHLRKYEKCFIGRDAVDWLLKMYHVQSRDEAVRAMQILQQSGVIHHVVDEHEFKDQSLFYRFTFDDDTFRLNRDLASFYRGVDIYRKLKSGTSSVLRDFYHKGVLYSEAFYGCDAVDFIVSHEGIQERDLVINEFRDLLERDIIKHDDYHFSDDRLIYEFNLDINKPCLLSDVVDMAQARTRGTAASSGLGDVDERASDPGGLSIPAHMRILQKAGLVPRPSIDSGMSGGSTSTECSHDLDTISETSQGLEPKSVLIRGASVQELENPSSPYVKRMFRIESDEMGFGFVLRGSAPCYIQAVDPLGPAALVGIKVRQFVASVNGQNVLRKDHRQVGLLISHNKQLILTVLVYRGDVDRL